ncbi:MAG: hypothetical protein ABW019_00290 [Chitinophagaceae bacterium]
MKKLFLAGAIIVSAMALAASTDHPQATQSSFPAVNTAAYQDTVPGRRKQPDTLPRPLPPDTTRRPLPPTQ